MKVVAVIVSVVGALMATPIAGLLLLGGGSDDPVVCAPEDPQTAQFTSYDGASLPCRPPPDDNGGGDPPPVVDDIDALRARAKAFADASAAGLPDPFYGDVDYYRWCARLAARIHGHSHAGYFSAHSQWSAYQVAGIAVADGSPPPPGALLFYASPPSGHVAVYLGNGLVISNDVLDAVAGRTGGVYIVDMEELTDGAWQLPYLGWAPPRYGQRNGRTSYPLKGNALCRTIEAKPLPSASRPVRVRHTRSSSFCNWPVAPPLPE